MGNVIKTAKLSEFLTDGQIDRALTARYADRILTEVILPNQAAITEKLGEPHDPQYLAHVIEALITEAISMVRFSQRHPEIRPSRSAVGYVHPPRFRRV